MYKSVNKHPFFSVLQINTMPERRVDRSDQQAISTALRKRRKKRRAVRVRALIVTVTNGGQVKPPVAFVCSLPLAVHTREVCLFLFNKEFSAERL